MCLVAAHGSKSPRLQDGKTKFQLIDHDQGMPGARRLVAFMRSCRWPLTIGMCCLQRWSIYGLILPGIMYAIMHTTRGLFINCLGQLRLLRCALSQSRSSELTKLALSRRGRGRRRSLEDN